MKNVVPKHHVHHANHHKFTTKTPRFGTRFCQNRQQKRASTTSKKLLQQNFLVQGGSCLFRRTDDNGSDPIPAVDLEQPTQSVPRNLSNRQPERDSRRQPENSTHDSSPETVLSAKTLHFRGISASISRSEPPPRYSTDKIAVEAVLSEPLSRPIPCYQGIIQGFLMGFAENIPGMVRQPS